VKEGRVIIVTGASSGIGRALAERAARSGFRVMAVGRRAERLEELQRVCQASTGAIETIAVELRTPGAPAMIVRETLLRYGRIDVVVNNAGGVAVGPILEQSELALREQFETHVFVPLALTREALPELKRNRGQVFFVGSGVARVPVAGLGAYPPAKAAVRNMTRIVRLELRRDKIAVTYVDPGAVASEFMTRAGFSGPPKGIAAEPHQVARKIFEAIKHRATVVNAVPWQTAFVGLAEAFPRATDFLLAKAPGIVGTADTPGSASTSERIEHAEPAVHENGSNGHAVNVGAHPEIESRSPFEDALAAHAVRMRKLNLSSAFVASLLVVPGRTLEVGDVSLRWAGMPNKNERALTLEILESLANAGFLTRSGDERYVVVRAADAPSEGGAV
jgi:short-subunit dehydrogenase